MLVVDEMDACREEPHTRRKNEFETGIQIKHNEWGMSHGRVIKQAKG